jgi:hypothetical protein
METTSGRGESFQFGTSAATRAGSTTRPGILVFSRTFQLLHVNRRAVELIGPSEAAATRPLRVVLSTPVIELRREVQQALDARLAAGRWDPFELPKTLGDPGHSMQLRGFGLPDQNAGDRSRIIILVEDVALGLEHAPRFASDHLPLPNFQEAVA